MNNLLVTPSPFAQVFEFNELIIGTDHVSMNTLSDEQAEWTRKAYNEEIAEFSKARDEQDLVGMVDATLDLIYFAMGTLKKMGLTVAQAEECMTAVHSANMTKKKGKLASRGNFGDDAVKPEGFVPPEEAIGLILFGDERAHHS